MGYGPTLNSALYLLSTKNTPTHENFLFSLLP